MTKPTRQEWSEIKNKLKSLYDTVYLRCDEYHVSLKLERINQFKNGIVVYINGFWHAKWLIDKTEEAERFFQLKSKAALPTKQLRALERTCGKRWCRKKGYYERLEYYDAPYWKSFNSLKRHLMANNDNIEVIYEPYKEKSTQQQAG